MPIVRQYVYVSDFPLHWLFWSVSKENFDSDNVNYLGQNKTEMNINNDYFFLNK